MELVRLAGFEPAIFCSGVKWKAANRLILRHGWQPKDRFRNAQDTQWVPNGYLIATDKFQELTVSGCIRSS